MSPSIKSYPIPQRLNTVQHTPCLLHSVNNLDFAFRQAAERGVFVSTHSSLPPISILVKMNQSSNWGKKRRHFLSWLAILTDSSFTCHTQPLGPGKTGLVKLLSKMLVLLHTDISFLLHSAHPLLGTWAFWWGRHHSPPTFSAQGEEQDSEAPRSPISDWWPRTDRTFQEGYHIATFTQNKTSLCLVPTELSPCPEVFWCRLYGVSISKAGLFNLSTMSFDLDRSLLFGVLEEGWGLVPCTLGCSATSHCWRSIH